MPFWEYDQESVKYIFFFLPWPHTAAGMFLHHSEDTFIILLEFKGE